MKFIKQVIDENLNPIYVKDSQGKFILANDAYTYLHGITVASLLQTGACSTDYANEKDLEVLKTGEALKTEEFYKIKSGQEVWLYTTKQIFSDSDGNRYLLSVSSDITAWKKALLKTEDAVKAEKESFIKFKKEINASINAIVGVTKLVKSNIYERETQEEYLNTIITIAEGLLVEVPTQATEQNRLVGALPRETQPLAGLSVLLAEDNAMNRLLVISQLKAWGVEVDITQDGEEALAKANERTYDLVLMDIQMPKLDGLTATTLIRQDTNPNQNTPIVAFTANLLDMTFEQYKQIGFTEFLRKPYDVNTLYQLLSKYKGQVNTSDINTEATTKAELALFDFSGLGDMAEDAVFIQKMKSLFIDLVPKQLEELTNSVQQQKWNEAADISHRLKSTYGNIKINAGADAMKKIEDNARNKINLDEINDLLAIANDVTNKVVAQFLQYNP